MNALLVIKLLDLAVLGFSAWERHQADRGALAGQLDTLRAQVRAGELGEAEAAAAVDALIAGLIDKRRAAFAALPKPNAKQKIDPGNG